MIKTKKGNSLVTLATLSEFTSQMQLTVIVMDSKALEHKPHESRDPVFAAAPQAAGEYWHTGAQLRTLLRIYRYWFPQDKFLQVKLLGQRRQTFCQHSAKLSFKKAVNNQGIHHLYVFFHIFIHTVYYI